MAPTLIAAWLATFPLLVISGNDDPSRLPQGIWLQITVLLLWTGHLTRSQTRWITPANWPPVAGFLVWAAGSGLLATNRFAAVTAVMLWAAAAGLMLWISQVDSAAMARRLLRGLFCGSVAVSLVGLWQYGTGGDWIPQAFPPAGTLANKNIAAGFVVAALPAGAIVFLRPSVSNREVFATAAGMAVSLAFVLQTGCRSAWLALLVQGIVTTAWLISRRAPRWNRSRWPAIPFGAGCFVAIASLSPANPGTDIGSTQDLLLATARPLGRLLSNATESLEHAQANDDARQVRAERSVAIRVGVWSNTVAMIGARPLTGVGAGNFQVHYPRFARSAGGDGTSIDQRVESAHNDLLQLLAEMGLVGTALLSWFVLSLGRGVAARLRNGRVEDQELVLVSFLGLIALSVEAVVTPTINQPAALVVGAVFAGLAQRTQSARTAGPRNGWIVGLRQPALVGAAALLVVASFSGITQVLADRHLLEMAYAEARQDWPGVIREGLMARQLNPDRKDSRFATASAMLRLGHAGEARDLLLELVATEPFNANALGNLAIAQSTLGDLNEAAASFERVLALRPDDLIASERLAAIRARTRSRTGPGEDPS